MAYHFPEDNESFFFDTACTSYSANFADFFDLGNTCHNTDASDGSTTYGSGSGSGSTETNLFDDLSLESSIIERDFFSSYADAFPSIISTIEPSSTFSHSQAVPKSTQAVPKCQRTIHRMRPESLAISSAQLIALENKDQFHQAAPLTAFRYPNRSTPPNTPPATPQRNSTQPSTPLTRQPRRMHRVDKRSSDLRMTSVPSSHKASATRTMSSRAHRKHTPDSSPPFAEWTERLRQLAVHSPTPSHALPISPPSSTKINQSELYSGNAGLELGIDIPGDIFGPSSSSGTTASSTRSKYPLTDDSNGSAIQSETWRFDTGEDFFNVKQDPWEFSVPDLNNTLCSIDSSSLESTTDASQNLDDLFTTNFGSGIEDALGISFGSTQLTSTVEPVLIHQPLSGNNSTKLPAMPFNSPASNFCSPSLTSDLTSFSIPTLPQPYSPATSSPLPRLNHHQQQQQHAPPKSKRSKTRGLSPSHPGTSRTSSNGKIRIPRAPKAANGGATGFVNFTPEDRNRILTGVAPSGSSKTKARREKEALEKRRKLSEAARRLVIEAGGDIEAVERELSE